jgi:RimJ/RimL family protein N-acetyltransferase
MSGIWRTIRGVTVRLEPWEENDLPLLQGLVGDPAMMEHLGGPETPEQIVARHARYLAARDAFKIVVDGVSAGWIGFWTTEWQGEQVYETGWSVLPAFQGRGVAGEATRLALELARASDGPRHIHAFPVPDNAPSNAICRKCGFTLLGAVSYEFPKGCWSTCNDWFLDLSAAS